VKATIGIQLPFKRPRLPRNNRSAIYSVRYYRPILSPIALYIRLPLPRCTIVLQTIGFWPPTAFSVGGEKPKTPEKLKQKMP